MTAIFGTIAVLFIACILENFCNVPVIRKTHDGLDRLFSGEGYLRFFFLTAVFAAALYAIGIVTMGPFLGIYNAAIEVGTLCVFALFGGWLMCAGSFVKDVGGRARELVGGSKMKACNTSIFFSTVFVTAVWGCIILLTFYDHSASGTLIGVSVNL